MSILPIGTTYYYNKRKYHIVKHCRDNGRLIYIVKYHGKYKQWWHYEAVTEDRLQLDIKYGLIKDLKL